MNRYMSEQGRWRCKQWINKYLSEAPRKIEDSYILKHMFQRMTGIYASNEEFQEVMRECGHKPVKE